MASASIATPTHLFRGSVDVARSTSSMAVALAAAKGAFDHLIVQQQLAPDKTAVVMDIDDTIIFEKDEDEDGRELRHPCGDEGMEKLRAMMTDLYEHCKKFGKVFLVTARQADRDVASWTVAELRAAGLRHWEGLYLCPRDQRESWRTIAEFKRNARREIARKGFTILLTVGDKWSDHMSHVDTRAHDKMDAGKAAFTLLRVTDEHQHTNIALKLPSR